MSFVRPVYHVVTARNWGAVPCHIVSSTLTPHSDSDGTSYSADVFYDYKVGQQTYWGHRATFSNTTRGSYGSKQSILSMYPAGSNAICYVNPANASDAVLNRGMHREIWNGLVSLIFVAFGLGMLIMATRQSRASLNPKTKWKPGARAVLSGGPVVLRPNSSLWGRVFVFGFIAAFWNGVVGAMVTHIVLDADTSIPFTIFSGLFSLPFIAVGLLLLAFFLHSVVSLGNARPILTLARGALRPGESTMLQFELRGGIFRPTALEIILEGKEEAIFTRGTDTVTDRSTFFLTRVFQSSSAIQNGSCTVSIPTGTMHSLDAPHNKIVWSLKLNGYMTHWSNLREEWNIVVEPAR